MANSPSRRATRAAWLETATRPILTAVPWRPASASRWAATGWGPATVPPLAGTTLGVVLAARGRHPSHRQATAPATNTR